MNIQLHTKNFTLYPALEEHARHKLEKLERYLPNISRVQAEISQQKGKNGPDVIRVQLTVYHQRGAVLRAEDKHRAEDADSAKIALNQAFDKMYRQIRRFKDKPRSKRMREVYGATPDELLQAEALPEEYNVPDVDELAEYEVIDATMNGHAADVTPNGLVRRRKEVVVTAMNEDEAIEQMELLGHTFFVFFNPDAAQMQVVYKREAGGYGLLEPRLA